MEIVTDDRAQAVQIGAVLLFGVLIIFLSFYQAFVIPDQNEEIEFNHNEELRQQMTELRSTVISMPGTATTKSVSVNLGVRYPSRTVFVNPGPASGSLRTVQTTNESVQLTIENATATGEAGDFWNGTNRTYNTGALEYRPGYNLYENAPRTVYEHGVLFNLFEDGDVSQAATGQPLVTDDRITLVTLNGSLSESRVGSVSVAFEPISTRTRTIEVKNDTDPITLSIPTAMNKSEWVALFEDESVAAGGNVKVNEITISDLPDVPDLSLVHIPLQSGTTYKLTMAKVGVGTQTTGTTEAYLTDVEGRNATVAEGSTKQLTFEVRDSYNNPLSDIEVNATTTETALGSSISPDSPTTDADGTVTFEYEAPDNIDSQQTITDQINVSIVIDPAGVAQFDGTTTQNVTMNVTVENTDGSGLGGSGATSPYSIQFDAAQSGSGDPGLSCAGGNCEYLVYDFADDDDTEFNLTTVTSPTAVGANVDWSLNTTDNGDFLRTPSETDNNGEAAVEFDPTSTGGVTVYVTSGGSGDTINVSLINTASDTVISAVGPNPDTGGSLSESEGEFVRVYFPSSTDTTGWTLEDDESSQGTTLPSETLQGEIYFVGDKDAFSTYWQIDKSKIYEFDDSSSWLSNSGEPLKLNDSSGNIVDEVAYYDGSGTGPTTSNGWNITIDDGDVGVRKKAGGTYIDNDEADDWRVEDENAFFPDANGGFQAVEATSIVPNADGQSQSFIFRLDEDLPTSEVLYIKLNDSQQTSPLQVDYGSASVGANRSLSNTNVDTDSGTARLTVEFSNSLSAGDAVRVTATSVNAGSLGDQNDPYDAVFQRSDVASNGTNSFEVSRNSGSSAIQSASVDDLNTDQAGQVQTVSFTLDSDLQSGEIVTIDLSDAQSTSGSTQVDYQNFNSISVVSGTGTISNSNTDSEIAYFHYTAGGGDTVGDTIEIEIDGVDTGPVSAQSNPYEIGISRGDAGTTSVSFDVTRSTIVDNFEDGDISEFGGDTNKFSTTTSTVYNGTYALEADPPGSLKTIESTSGLPTYPQEGDTFAYNFYPTDFANQQYVAGIAFGESSSGNNYAVSVTETGGQTDTFELVVDNGLSTSASSTFSLSTNQWYEVNIDWTSTDVAANITNPSNGNVIATVSVGADGTNDVDYLAFRSKGGLTIFDYLRRT
jgi:hypothetical protein